MNALTSTPFLFATQIVFLWMAVRRTIRQGLLTSRSQYAVLLIAVALTLWGIVSTMMALSGVYDSSAFFLLLPGLWLPFVPFAIIGSILLTLPSTLNGIRLMTVAVPAHWWVSIQALRIFALGTLIKTLMGRFPVHVELAIGLTDLVFGMSAAILYPLVRNRRVSLDAIAIWHMIGVLIILVPGELAIQTGLPGQLQIFSDAPTSGVMLDFPMVLAPTLVVPAFLLLNILGAYAALHSRKVK